jgi:hypothetical protein
MSLNAFDNTIDEWIKALNHYTFTQLVSKPFSGSWSLGQLYNHLIDDCNFYIEQIKICVTNNDHASEEAAPDAKTMFQNNSFPDVVLEGSPNNAFIPQPVSKELLMQDLLNLKAAMTRAAELIAKSTFNGKTKHPGLNYFNAAEWLQFADMHFRHHLRQKQRLDSFLKKQV